jgi:predicted nucleotide-binding protein with TIR-like domain
MTLRPLMFVGSSGGHLDIAHALGNELKADVEPRVWDKGVFGLASNTIDELCSLASQADLAVFVFGADDVSLLRDNLHVVPRDNVVFELGMFIGALDRARAFFVIPRGMSDLHVPTDLAGVTAAHFDPTLKITDPNASIRSAANDIRAAIAKLPGHAADSGAGADLLFEGSFFQGVTTPFLTDPGYSYAPLASNLSSTTAACTAALGRSCVANATSSTTTFPLDQTALASFGQYKSSMLQAYPADEVPFSVPHLAGPGHI